MSGKLIVFEGTDGSGKATQTALLCRYLEGAGVPYRKITFPRYGQPSAAMVQAYLGGELGKHPGDVNAYAATLFYAVDRYASYKQDWGGFYENGGLIVADRYTTSNAVHQASKLPDGERETYLDWLFDLEYRTRCSTWTCPPQRRSGCSGSGRPPGEARPTSTSRTRPTWPSAGRTPGRWSAAAAGR